VGGRKRRHREQNVAGSISLEELVALNDEIAGLVRSGVPLEISLSGWGRGLPGRLGRIVTALGKDMAQGKSLPQSLADAPANFPPVYRAIVTSGIRAGRLPAALESLASSARNLQEVRRCVGLAVLYPLVVVVLGYFALWLVLVQLLPGLLEIYEGNSPATWTALVDVGRLANSEVPIAFTDRVIVAGFIPPLALVVVATLWWLATRRAVGLGTGWTARLMGCIPVAGRTIRDARLASLSEILALLVEHGVGLSEAVVLAAECTADRRLVRTARRLAAALDRGSPLPPAEQLVGFPPLVAWLVESGSNQQTFVTVARHVADTYRRRIVRHARWLRDYLPMWLVVIVGGGLVTLLAMLTFLPFTELMQNLSDTIDQSLRVKP
jgi:general secretion pathway protein F